MTDPSGAAAHESIPSVAAVQARLEELGITLPPGPVRVDRYGDSDALSEELLALIRAGNKRAGTSLVWAIEADGDKMPQTGDIEVIVDHRNEPAFITRTVQSYVVPFSDVTAEYAAIEGEGDSSLDYWRRVHWIFFTRECARIGREASESMPVACSVFEVLEVL